MKKIINKVIAFVKQLNKELDVFANEILPREMERIIREQQQHQKNKADFQKALRESNFEKTLREGDFKKAMELYNKMYEEQYGK